MFAPLLLLQLAANVALPAPATGNTAMVPVNKWVVDFAPDTCLVQRDFGTKEAPLTFGFRLWPLATTTELVLQGDAADFKLPETGKMEIAADGKPLEGPNGFQSWQPKSPTPGGRITVIHADFDAFRQMAASKVWTFKYGRKSIALQTGAMVNLFQVLTNCERDLLKTWQIDPAELDRPDLRAKPAGDPANWFSGEYYPQEAKKAGAEARVVTFLTIDTNGRVSDCKTLGKPSGYDFDKVTCGIFTKNARFIPPRDATGKPIISHQIAPPIRWQLSQSYD